MAAVKCHKLFKQPRLMWDSVYSAAPAINALSRQPLHPVVRDNAEMRSLQAEGGAGNSGPAPSLSQTVLRRKQQTQFGGNE